MDRTLCLLLIALAACGGGTDTDDTHDTDVGDDWQLQSFVDEGEVCAEGASGGPLELTVAIQDCLSSSCSREFQGSCQATVDGATITLTSDISWEENVAPNAACTDDCGAPVATCTVEGLADGTYTVLFGDQELTVELPSEGTGCGYR